MFLGVKNLEHKKLPTKKKVANDHLSSDTLLVLVLAVDNYTALNHEPCSVYLRNICSYHF